MPKKGRPSYTTEGNSAVLKIKADIERDVRGIAESIAIHERAEKVLETHVETAYATLAHLGLKRRRWYGRQEFEVGVGTLLIAIAGVFASAADYFFPHLFSAPFKLSIIIVLAVVGAVLSLHGWMRWSF
jgi:hypothetical protein